MKNWSFFYALVLRFQCNRKTKIEIKTKGKAASIMRILTDSIPTSTNIYIIKDKQETPTNVKTLFGVF